MSKNSLDKQKMTANEMVDALMKAIDLQNARLVEKLEFDKTIICKIEDDTNKSKGEYIVTDGSSSFTAYSDITTYLPGIRVYVTVPNGNFDNKKIITGRYVDSENSEYYTYKPPFEDYLDMTGNLIKDELNGSLIANYPEQKEIILWQQDNFTQGKGYSLLGIKADFRSWLNQYRAIAGNYGLRLDIQSKEQSTSQNEPTYKFYSCYLTNKDMYGNSYNFESFYNQEKTFDISHISEIVSMKLVFYQEPNTFLDKNGQAIPYLGVLDKIEKLQIEKERMTEVRDLNVKDFEDENSYYAKLEEIQKKYDDKLEKLEEIYPPNLFVKNPYISLGYAESDFSEDTVLTMSVNSLTYDATSTKEQNTKIINTRWIHFIKDENDKEDIVSIDYEDEIPNNAKIHWYRYFLREGLNDELAGNFWTEISNENKLSYTFYPDVNSTFEKIKVIVEYPSRDYINTQRELEINGIENSQLSEGEKLVKIQEIQENYSYDSQVKYYESNVITFENEKPVANPATVDLIQGLQIKIDPSDKGGLDGNYCIYGMDYKLLNSAEKERLRPLEATYSSLVTGETSLDKASKITWKIPLQSTMIAEPVPGKEFWYTEREKDINGAFTGNNITDNCKVFFLYADNTTKEWIQGVNETETNNNKPSDANKATHMLIERDGSEKYFDENDPDAVLEKIQIQTIQYFRIKDYYTQSASNNEIVCEIVKNNIKYPARANLNFGPQGSNGTDYTLSLAFEKGESCLKYGTQPVKIIATLYNYENKVMEDAKCAFSWYVVDDTNTSKIDIINKKDMECQLKINSTYYNNNNKNNASVKYYILQGVVKYNTQSGEVDLTAYLPIPIKYDTSYTLVEAPSTIIYDNAGTNPNYYKGALNVYKQNQSSPYEDEISWFVETPDTTGQEAGYYPVVRTNPTTKHNELLAANIFYHSGENSSIDKRVSLICMEGNKVIFAQPLLIEQNRWPSAMLNKWDGTLQIDDKQGTILSQMVGAGYKDDKNRFNGVLMGNVDLALEKNTNYIREDDITSGIAKRTAKNKTGVYGYHQGAPSFGLMEDGTAFFGKAGAGQILIDGTSSTIQSSAYKNGTGNAQGDLGPKQQGMLIDLDHGFIDMQGAGEGNKAVVHLDTRGGDKNPYLNIKSKAGHDMMMITTGETNSDNEYYLQTDNYDNTIKLDTPSGVKLDLVKGSLTGYNFSLSGIQGSGQYKGSYFKLNSDGSPYFEIFYKDTQGPTDTSRNSGLSLIKINKSDFYMNSHDWKSGESGTKISLGNKGKIESYNFKLKAENPSGTYKGSYFEMNSDGSPYFRIHYVKTDGTTAQKEGLNLINISNSKFDLYSQDWENGNSGTHIDLADGKIESYKFNLKAYYVDDNGKVDTDKKIVINSGAKSYPLYITSTSKFSVTWDGKLTCDGAKIDNATINNASINDGTISDAYIGDLYLIGKTDNVKVSRRSITYLTDIGLSVDKASRNVVVNGYIATESTGKLAELAGVSEVATALYLKYRELNFIYYIKLTKHYESVTTLTTSGTTSDSSVTGGGSSDSSGNDQWVKRNNQSS